MSISFTQQFISYYKLENKLAENCISKQGLVDTGRFFQAVLSLVNRVIRYLLLVGGGRNPVDLVEVRKKYPGHHGYHKTKKTMFMTN